MRNRNVVIILSDEHSRKVVGPYGNALVRTPTLDALAHDGTVFTNAYCNSPICVPSRASLATGRYVHEIGSWDNAHPYDGDPPSFAHVLRDRGHDCVSIGKLHYRSSGLHNGFTRELLPLHVPGGEGDIQGLVRSPPVRRHPESTSHLAKECGPGQTPYQTYDRSVRDAAVEWLGERHPGEKPWCLFVSFVSPHFPLVAPPEFFALYEPAEMPLPPLRGEGDFPDHPVLKTLRDVQDYDACFRDADNVRVALAAYYGMVSFLDDNIGHVLAALEATGLADDTLVVYASDHGDNLGTRRLWGKLNLFEESAGIPMIVRGPGVPAGRRVDAPVSLVDVFPTVVETVTGAAYEAATPGRSLVGTATDPLQRPAFCEYHGPGSSTGCFMVRFGDYKYIHYEGYRAQLFDLREDPSETRDLGSDVAMAHILERGLTLLRTICDPRDVTRRAFADQRKLIARHGGEAAVRQRGGFPYTPAPGETIRAT